MAPSSKPAPMSMGTAHCRPKSRNESGEIAWGHTKEALDGSRSGKSATDTQYGTNDEEPFFSSFGSSLFSSAARKGWGTMVHVKREKDKKGQDSP